MVHFPTSPLLSSICSQRWVSRTPSSPSGSHEWSMPTGVVHIALRADGPGVEVDGKRRSRAVLCGPRVRAYRRDTPGGIRSMGLVLTPWAVPALFGIPASILREQHIDLEELLGDDSLRIEAYFAEGKSDVAMEELQAALLRRLQPQRLPDRALSHAISALRSTSIPIATIATQVGWSERHLRDRVYQTTGLSPRELSRIARLQRLLKQVEREKHAQPRSAPERPRRPQPAG